MLETAFGMGGSCMASPSAGQALSDAKIWGLALIRVSSALRR